MRLIGVDTPETPHPTCGEQTYRRQAEAFTASRLAGESVALELDAEKVDLYGRALAYAWVSADQMFNATLLRKGHAQVATFPPNVKYEGRFLAAQRAARDAGRGLWGLPAGQLCQPTDRGNGVGVGGGDERPRRGAGRRSRRRTWWRD